MRSPRPLDLKGICRGSGMRLQLDGAEVWRGLTFLGTVSADWLAAQIQDRLDTIEIGEWLRAELAADPTRALSPPAPPTRILTAAYVPISRTEKATRRAARKRRKGARHAKGSAP